MRFFCGGFVCTALIALAVLIGLVQLLLPLAANYPDRVASILASRLHQPVRFASMQGYWQASGPLLVLHDMQIGSPGGTPLELPTADVKVDLGALLRPRGSLINLRLHDLHLDVQRRRDGTWGIAGFGAGGGISQRLDLRQLPGSVLLSNLQVNIRDAADNRTWSLRSDTLRVINDGDTLRIAGTLRRSNVTRGLKVAGRFALDGDSGKLYVGGRNVDLGRLLAGLDFAGHGIDSGHGDLQFWLDWKQARVDAITARLDLADLSMHAPQGKIHIAHEKGLFGFTQGADGLRIRYAGPHGAQARIDVQAPGAVVRSVTARARHLDLGMLLPLLAQWPHVPSALGSWWLAANPHGILDTAHVAWTASDGLQDLDAGFHGLGMQPAGSRPGFGPLHGRVLGDAEAVLLELPGQATTLRLPDTFRTPLALHALQGDITTWKEDGTWHIGTGALTFAGQGFAGQARGQVRLPGADGKPWMGLYVALQDVDVAAARQLLPVDALPPTTLDWLDRALVAGRLTHAEVLVHGDLAHWPFDQHRGRFEARGDIDGLTLAYSPNWPRAEGVHAVASFVDDGMLVQADAGHALGNQVSKAVASIPMFHDAQLLLSVQGHGTGASMLDFARRSPIARKQDDALKQLKLGGTGSFGFSLVLPFRNSRQFTLAGSAHVQGVDVDDPAWGIALDGLGGTLHYDGSGLKGQGLAVRYNGTPATLDLALGTGATGDPSTPVRVAMHGRFDVASLVSGHPALDPLTKCATGNAAFDLGFAITDAADGHSRQILTVDSSLDGIALELPSPLDKPPSGILPLHMRLELPLSGGDLHVSLGHLLQAHARLPADAGAPLALAVMLGSTPLQGLPSSGIRVGGHAENLDVSGWLHRALDIGGGAARGLRLDGVDVQIDHALLFGATFTPLHLVLDPQPGKILMRLDGPQVAGTLTLPTMELQRRGIMADLDRLYWPDDAASPPLNRLQQKADASVAAPRPPTTANHADDADYARTGINPAELPPLHISVGDLRLGKAHLGEARFESWPTAKGMHIDQLRTHTHDVQIMATGDWLGDAANSHTHMNIDFGAENLGSLLTTLGFQGLFEGGRTSAHLDATWPGEPSSVALARMRGTLGIQVSTGRIPEVQPGMGRLLGLMAVTELPRRLALDFGDVFGKGFSFDAITATFHLEDGVAVTDNLKLKGSAADITITGRTNLRARTYDQKILVVPHVGNSLPVVGALAAGPVGAAAGLAVQGLLGRGLNKAASARYTMTGPWENPRITLVEKHQTHPSASPARPVSGPVPSTAEPDAAGVHPAASGSAVRPAAATSASP